MRRLTVVATALAVALTGACTDGGDTAEPQAAPSSSAPTDEQLSEQALAVKPPATVAPEQVEDLQFRGEGDEEFSPGDGFDAYRAAVKQFTVLRQLPGLLVSRPKVEADFKRVLDVSAPEHDAFLKEKIALYLDSASNGGSRTDAAAVEAGDTLKGALTIVEPVAGASGGGAGGDSATAFSHFDPEAGAFAPIRLSRTASYGFTDTQGRPALAVAFDAVVPYNVVGVDGQKQTLQITVTDFRMVMKNVVNNWQWDGWDLVDVKAELLPRV